MSQMEYTINLDSKPMAQIHRMTFMSDEMSSLMFKKLYEQKEASRFCDITLLVNNKIVKAHRNILACSSPYFNSILKQNAVVREQLSITCLDSEIFNMLVNYMYTGQITIELSNVEELLRLADHFIITKIVEYCIEFLGANLNIDNCLFTYYISRRFKLKHLNNVAENWIFNRLNEVCDGREILKLDVLELMDFLKNQVFNISCFKSLYIISEWILKDIKRKEQHCSKLLMCLQWNNFEPSDVFGYLDACALFSKSEICFYYLLNSLFQNNLLLPSFKSKYDELHLKYGECNINDEGDRVLEMKDEEDKIIISERIERRGFSSKILIIDIRRNLKQKLLRRLLFCSLKPRLRMFLFKHHKLFFGDCDKFAETTDNDDKTSVKCPVCLASIKDSLLLEQHLALSHSKDVTYKCGICAFACQYHGDYTNHMKNHFPGPPFKCDYCDETENQISKLISHRSKHVEESTFQCTFCSFKCRVKENFLSHLKLHTPEKQFKCENCTKAFRFKHNLESHKLTHNSEKTWTCESCGFYTKILNHMIAHKRIHAGDIYKCSYPHCKYSTSKKNQLLSHSKTHNGVRPHSCGVCGRGFMEKSHLVRHERIHLEEKPFKCTSCDYASSRRDKLKEHFTRHHGENASAKVPYKARPMRNCSSKAKPQSPQEVPSSTNSTNPITFAQTITTTSASSTTQPAISSEIQDLILHHQNHTPSPATNVTGINPNYHHFVDVTDFHHHGHTHNIQQQLLASHNQRSVSQQNGTPSHHILPRNNNPTTSTAAAVAAAMMLDARFHHNSNVPYHSNSASASAAMAAVQSSQQLQTSIPNQHAEYPTSIPNCMTLF